MVERTFIYEKHRFGSILGSRDSSTKTDVAAADDEDSAAFWESHADGELGSGQGRRNNFRNGDGVVLHVVVIMSGDTV